MPRGYRYVVLTLVGWLILTGDRPPSPHQGKENSKATDSYSGILSALNEAHEADHPNKPCAPEHPDRNSDLCAQWQAADAALRSANADESQVGIGVAGVVIGFLTLVAAGAAAKFAYDAAIETKRSADVSDDALRFSKSQFATQVRPYVNAKPVSITINNMPSTDGVIVMNIGFKVDVSNYGTVPARKFEAAAVIKELDWPINEADLPDIENAYYSSFGLVFPNEPVTLNFEKPISFDVPAHMAGIRRVCLVTLIRYSGISNEDQFTTINYGTISGMPNLIKSFRETGNMIPVKHEMLKGYGVAT